MKGRTAEDNTSTKGGSVQSTPSVAPEVPAPVRRSRRSVSPKKQGAPRGRAASKAGSTSGRGRKKKGSVIDDESVASTSPSLPFLVPEEVVVKAREAVENVAEEEEKSILDTIIVGVPPRSLSPPFCSLPPLSTHIRMHVHL